MDKVIENKRGLELVTSVSSGHKTNSGKFHLTKFDDVMWSSFWVIHDMINYSTSIYPFESGRCGEERKKSQKIEYLENKKSFSDKINNIFRCFWRAIIWWKNKKVIKTSGHTRNTNPWRNVYDTRWGLICHNKLHLFLYLQGDTSGLRKWKNGQASTLITATSNIYLSQFQLI